VKKSVNFLLFGVCAFALLSLAFSNAFRQIFALGAAFFALSALTLFNIVKDKPPKPSETDIISQKQETLPQDPCAIDKEKLNEEKIAVLSKFASVVSHDLKNPLSSIKNIAYYFTNAVKVEGETPNKMLKMLSSEADRMNLMIVDLLDMTRVKRLAPSLHSLDVLIDEAARCNQKENVSFSVEQSGLNVCVDPLRFKQVIQSVIKNSMDAMENGGSISIKTYPYADRAVIEISDNGEGMDEETLNKCFDPMFSTRQAKAMGMSLTVAKQIITMSGGDISAQSSLGNGTKITIRLSLAK
jgi:signal transduction histidine kinase